MCEGNGGGTIHVTILLMVSSVSHAVTGGVTIMDLMCLIVGGNDSHFELIYDSLQ